MRFSYSLTHEKFLFISNIHPSTIYAAVNQVYFNGCIVVINILIYRAVNFELKCKDLVDFEKLCSKILFNPAIRSAVFDDDFKVIVNLERNKLADFSILIKNLKVKVTELRIKV
jgi:hypothetical protein